MTLSLTPLSDSEIPTRVVVQNLVQQSTQGAFTAAVEPVGKNEIHLQGADTFESEVELRGD